MVLMAAVTGVSVAQAAQQRSSVKLFVAGNDQVLWLVVGQWDQQEETYIHSFAVMDTSSTQIRAANRIPLQKGTIERIAAAGKALHVFYGPDARYSEDGAHYQYDRSGEERAISLPGSVMPSAIAGKSGSDRPRLWAVVPTTTAKTVRAAWEKRQWAATQPAESDKPAAIEDTPSALTAFEPTTKNAPASLSPETYHLVQYDGVYWQPGFPAPATCAVSERMWLGLGTDRFHLFWQVEPTEAQIHYAWYEKDTWVIGPSLPLDEPPVDAFAGIINARLIFAALQYSGKNSKDLQASLWAWQPGNAQTGEVRVGTWSRLSALKDSTGQDLILPADATVGAFVDKLAVLRAGDQPAEFALFAPMTGGAPDRKFQEIPLVGAGNISRTQRNLRDLVATLVVAALLLLVFWRRQESIATAVPLPAGVVIVGPGKRAAAAIVDMLPAAAVAGMIWYQPIHDFIVESQAAVAASQSETVKTPDAVMWAWVCYAGIYTIWCTVFEISWMTTPGKRLMGCEVRQENFSRPNAVQIVIRNITKIIELLPYLQIWPFMLVVFFTRNHQRLGDLLAHTIIVEQQHIVTGSGDESDDTTHRD